MPRSGGRLHRSRLGGQCRPAVYEGALVGRHGNRRPPTAAYGGDSPELQYDITLGKWAGGMFWDGRATGAHLGDPLADQAQGPFLNPLEQAMPNARLLAVKVATSEYADLFEQVWGPGSLDFAGDVDGTFDRIARSIAAYEGSSEVNPFTSKFDVFWDNAKAAGKDVTKIKFSGGGMGGGGMGGGGMMDPYRWQNYRGLGLADNELQGLAMFNDPNRADCASCHTLHARQGRLPAVHQLRVRQHRDPEEPREPVLQHAQTLEPGR